MNEEDSTAAKEEEYQEPVRGAGKKSDESFASRYGIYIAGVMIMAGVAYGMIKTFSGGQPPVSAPVVLPPAKQSVVQPMVPPVGDPSQATSDTVVQMSGDKVPAKEAPSSPHETVKPIEAAKPGVVAPASVSPVSPIQPVSNMDSSKIKKLKARLDALEKKIAKLDEKVVAKKEVAYPVKLVVQEKKLVVPVKPLVATVKKPEPAAKTEDKPVEIEAAASKKYRIHAIVSGRAWLAGPDGALVTVSVGDSVPGEGVVTKIDPDNGVVRVGNVVIK